MSANARPDPAVILQRSEVLAAFRDFVAAVGLAGVAEGLMYQIRDGVPQAEEPARALVAAVLNAGYTDG